METYERMTLEKAALIPFAQLVDNYNNVIEDIWFLQHRLQELRTENESLWQSYDELLDHVHG